MSFWTAHHARTIDPQRFRAHDQYLEQADHYPYESICLYLKEIGAWEWVLKCGEDGAYGCVTRNVHGVTVSRDLLDSVLEIHYLRTALGNAWFSEPKIVLDIGAGYGRLVHRMYQLFPRIFMFATDEIPVSLDVARTYLKSRGLADWVLERPLIGNARFNLAINVHSWSECTLDEISTWLEMLARLNVPRLFIVPHTPDMGSWAPGVKPGEGPSYRELLAQHGYLVESHWSGPPCNPRRYYLFARVPR